jgi:hypothetical protein
VAEKFSVVWIADASTLEAMKKHFGQLQEKIGSVLAGKSDRSSPIIPDRSLVCVQHFAEHNLIIARRVEVANACLLLVAALCVERPRALEVRQPGRFHQ